VRSRGSLDEKGKLMRRGSPVKRKTVSSATEAELGAECERPARAARIRPESSRREHQRGRKRNGWAESADISAGHHGEKTSS